MKLEKNDLVALYRYNLDKLRVGPYNTLEARRNLHKLLQIVYDIETIEIGVGEDI